MEEYLKKMLLIFFGKILLPCMGKPSAVKESLIRPRYAHSQGHGEGWHMHWPVISENVHKVKLFQVT